MIPRDLLPSCDRQGAVLPLRVAVSWQKMARTACLRARLGKHRDDPTGLVIEPRPQGSGAAPPRSSFATETSQAPLAGARGSTCPTPVRRTKKNSGLSTRFRWKRPLGMQCLLSYFSRLAVNSVVVGSPPPRPGRVTFSFISSPLTVPSYLVIDSPF